MGFASDEMFGLRGRQMVSLEKDARRVPPMQDAGCAVFEYALFAVFA
jgi:hypothetical protein